MPGHKRNTNFLGSKFPYDLDITEIDGFDNLHKPEGIIKDIENKAKEIYDSKNSFLLVNGSTAGILAGITSVLKRGDRTLIARNCHKSVYNGLELAGAEVHYIFPEADEYGIFKAVDPIVLEKKIKDYNPKLIIITSPTYEGVHSDIKAICKIAHSYNTPVMVDAAHGAHYTENVKYADITIMSLHKTLPALTQCALAHVNGNLVNADEFRIKLSVFGTSSPSYVLMASIEECLDFFSDSKPLFERLSLERKNILKIFKSLNHLKVFEYDDITKLIVFNGNSNISGIELADMLRNDYNIEVEMASRDYIVLITTVCDDFDSYQKLANALFEIDGSLKHNSFIASKIYDLPEKASNADYVCEKKAIDIKDSIGEICAEFIWAYPPGIPLIVPGEIILEQTVDYIIENIKLGVNVQSSYSKLPQKIYCQLR